MQFLTQAVWQWGLGFCFCEQLLVGRVPLLLDTRREVSRREILGNPVSAHLVVLLRCLQ